MNNLVLWKRTGDYDDFGNRSLAIIRQLIGSLKEHSIFILYHIQSIFALAPKDQLRYEERSV